MADEFEITYQWVALRNAVGSMEGGSLTTMVPVEGDSFYNSWHEASELAKQGWELVGAFPITAGAFPPGSNTFAIRDIAFSFTSAFVLLFKRRIE